MARYISDQKKNFEAFKEASFESYTAASHVNARVVEYMKLLDSKGGEQVRTLDVIYNNQIVAGVLLLPGVKVRPRMHRMTKIGHDPLQYVLSLTDEPDISK